MAAPRPPRLDATADEVARIAAAAPDWPALAAAARPCVACPELAAVRQHVVVGDVPVGPPRFALVGEAPGATEDETGRPFVGRSGALLDQLLAEAGLARSEAAVLNIVKCRPPGNRTPTAHEVARCSGWLRRQLELLDPPIVVALGLSAAKWFLGPRTVLARARAEGPHDYAGRALWPTYHPSAAIRFGPNGAPRAALLADLSAVAASLGRRPA
ncbi:uracil-DNA glycosylase [Blastococcus sp. CT_GayMR19]|uniref:uracil-DNA glycosylase n=1 Tax=Blastococcus sp. CT_GayMR19 TaxID=2559608 RepID=UPI001074436A|nr:uracil-DNA glycosylase [Blastococcus sp. CT_GayMR19]TFV76005.1 uracil-DNA glycosylase [Blastococcus sp. CT_GayMR19]